MEDQFYCLGIKALGLCSYNPAKPNNIYFSIGDAVAAIALVLAFTQLITPTLKFRLTVSSKAAWVAAGLFLVAVIFIFVAAILPNIPGAAVPLLGYPIFWEVTGGVLVVCASLLLSVYLRAVVFNEKNYKKFFHTSLSIIARGNEQDLRALADEVRNSAPAIIEAAYQYDQDLARQTKVGNKGYAVPEQTEYALALLDLLSDERFCTLLVNAAPATALNFIQEIIKYGSRERAGYAFVQQVVKQSFISDNSILHREQEYYGLGHFKTFTRTVFGDYRFIASAYRPLQAWPHWQEEFSTRKIIQKYSTVICTAFEAYFEAKDYGQYPAALYVGVEHLAESAQFRLPRMENIPEEDVYNSEAFSINYKIGDALSVLLELVVRHENDIPDYAFDEATYDRFKDASIYGVLAFGIYKFLENLAMDRAHDEAIRMIAINLWLAADPVSDEQKTKAILEIQKRLIIHLKKKITDNLEQLRYPMITRLMISLIGLNEPQEGSTQAKSFALPELHELLKSKIANAFDMDETKAQHILPSDTTFDRQHDSLVWKRKWEKTQHSFKVHLPISEEPIQ